MRKFMDLAQRGSYSSYALEAEGDVDTTNPDAVAAADAEADTKLDEAAVLAEEVPAAITECYRMEQISDTLEDLAVVADGIDEASPEEVALIRSVSDMAVAGTDVESEEVIPETVVPLQVEVSGEAGNVVTESRYIGHRISTEGIRETARNIWEAIWKFLKDIWAKIEKFFYKIFGTIPMLRRKIEAIKKRAADLQSDGKRPGKEKITITSGVAALSVDYTPQATATNLITALEKIDAAAKWVYGTHATKLVKLGEAMAEAIGSFDPANKHVAIIEMSKLLRDSVQKCDIPNAKEDNSRHSGYKTKIGENLLGNLVLEYREKVSSTSTELDNSNAGGSALVNVANLSSVDYRLTVSKVKTPTEKEEFTITPFDGSDIEDLCSKMLKLLGKLEDFKRGSMINKIISTKEKLKKASDKAEVAMSKIKDRVKTDDDTDDDKAERASVPAYRVMINTNTAFAKWSSSPTMTFFKYAISEINAICAISSKSLSTYTSK